MRGGGEREDRSQTLKGHLLFLALERGSYILKSQQWGVRERGALSGQLALPDWKQLWAFEFGASQRVWCVAGVRGDPG